MSWGAAGYVQGSSVTMANGVLGVVSVVKKV